MNTQTKLIDLTFLADFTKNDQGKMKRYIEMYLKSAPAVIDEFQKELDDKSFENLRLKAHSIKPQVQYMGISTLKKVLIEIERVIQSGNDNDQLSSLIKKAKTISDQATIELQLFLHSV